MLFRHGDELELRYLSKLLIPPTTGHGIEIIRITAHDYDIKDGMDFARRIKELGYKSLHQLPSTSWGYSDKDLLWIFEQVNEIHPGSSPSVDTFGSMRRRDLERIVSHGRPQPGPGYPAGAAPA